MISVKVSMTERGMEDFAKIFKCKRRFQPQMPMLNSINGQIVNTGRFKEDKNKKMEIRNSLL